jgi:hypothetical protein
MEKSLKEEVNIRLEFLLAIIFLAGMSGVSFWYFHSNARPLTDLSIFEFFILVLAVFRLTRLFVYDGIMQYVRDLCLIKEQVTDPLTNKEKIICHKPTVGLRKVLSDLLACPWCVGVWLSAIVIIVYTVFPLTHLIIFVLAVAGLATFVQITINAIGWNAEKEKLLVKDKQQE